MIFMKHLQSRFSGTAGSIIENGTKSLKQVMTSLIEMQGSQRKAEKQSLRSLRLCGEYCF
jgi:hypothetical protein